MDKFVEDKIIELVDRTRRIETKLSRYIAGEDDRGVTNVEYGLMRTVFGGWVLHLHTSNITLKQLSKILTDEGVPSGKEVTIKDDDRPVLTITMR